MPKRKDMLKFEQHPSALGLWLHHCQSQHPFAGRMAGSNLGDAKQQGHTRESLAASQAFKVFD